MTNLSTLLSWTRPSAGTRSEALQRASIPLLLTVLVLGSSWIVLAHPQLPIWDQQALLEARFRSPNYPAPGRGFTSQLIVATHHAFSGVTGAEQNAQLKVIAMALYGVAGALLATATLRRRSLVALLLLFLFSSRYPFLWLSSELFAGAFLMLAIYAWTVGSSPWLVGVSLALLGLCKPDLIVVSVALLVYWMHRRSSREEALALAGGFSLSLALLLLPGTLLEGFDYFHSYARGGRSFASFSQHYAALIAHFQIAGTPPNPWSDTAAYMERIFPGARSMSDVVFGRFGLYAEFVALSIVRGLFRTAYVVNYAALAIPCLAWAWRQGRFQLTDRERALYLSFIGFAPLVLFAYPHVRYLARYYPIFLILVFSALERLLGSEDRTVNRPMLLASGACLVVSLLENLRRLSGELAQVAQLDPYWFPD